MADFRALLGSDPLCDRYAAMKDSELLAFAKSESNRLTPKIRFLRELQAADGVLYQELRARQLTTPLADALGLEGQRRTPEGAKKGIGHSPRFISRQERYRGMLDDEIIAQVRALRVVGSHQLQRCDSVLYGEIRARPQLRERLVELGWRRPSLRPEMLSVEDWINLCSEFDSASAFRENYTAAYGHALHQKLWPQIKGELARRGIWKRIIGLDGCLYDSRAECIVANLLHLSCLSYMQHPVLPWKKNSGRPRADFRLLDYNVWVEVFMCSEEGIQKRSDLPTWARTYTQERKVKHGQYEKNDDTGICIEIEAEIYRYAGISAYVQHIRESFSRNNITLANIPATHLLGSAEQRGMAWNIAEFLDYAAHHGIKKLSDFESPGHRDLYRAMTVREMHDDVRAALDENHGRRTEAAGKFKLSVDEVRQICQHYGIDNKTKYSRAHRDGRLPVGAPACIRQTYKIDWSTFFGRKRRDDLWPWGRARDFVRSQRFKSRSDFLAAVRKRADMAYIRKSPGSRVGGYIEFAGWPDFLGKS